MPDDEEVTQEMIDSIQGGGDGVTGVPAAPSAFNADGTLRGFSMPTKTPTPSIFGAKQLSTQYTPVDSKIHFGASHTGAMSADKYLNFNDPSESQFEGPSITREQLSRNMGQTQDISVAQQNANTYRTSQLGDPSLVKEAGYTSTGTDRFGNTTQSKVGGFFGSDGFKGAMAGVQAGVAVYGAYQAHQNYKLAKDKYASAKRTTNINFARQAKEYNNNLVDMAAKRAGRAGVHGANSATYQAKQLKDNHMDTASI